MEKLFKKMRIFFPQGRERDEVRNQLIEFQNLTDQEAELACLTFDKRFAKAFFVHQAVQNNWIKGDVRLTEEKEGFDAMITPNGVHKMMHEMLREEITPEEQDGIMDLIEENKGYRSL